MDDRSRFKLFLLTTGSFIGGAALGLMLAPLRGKENRRWIRKNTTGLTAGTDALRRNALRYGAQRLNQLLNHFKRELRNNVPDLYEATEFIDLELE